MSPAGADAAARIRARVASIPPGFVASYGDVWPPAPRLAVRVLASSPGLPWWRVVRADGTAVKGARQRGLLAGEGVAMRGERVDMRRARVPVEVLDG